MNDFISKQKQEVTFSGPLLTAEPVCSVMSHIQDRAQRTFHFIQFKPVQLFVCK